MKTFEEVLTQYEPMISSLIRKTHIYRDFEQYRQAGKVALWQAWERFDLSKGDFTPFAYRSIRGALLDEMKIQNRFEQRVIQMEDDILEMVIDADIPEPFVWSEKVDHALFCLSDKERELISWLFVEGLSLNDCAAQIGISVAGVKKRRERTLLKLHDSLTKTV